MFPNINHEREVVLFLGIELQPLIYQYSTIFLPFQFQSIYHQISISMGGCISGKAKRAQVGLQETNDKRFLMSKSVLQVLKLSKNANPIDGLLGYGLAKSSLPLDSQWAIVYQQKFSLLKEIYNSQLVGIQSCVYILMDALEEIMERKFKSEDEKHRHFVDVFSQNLKNVFQENDFIVQRWQLLDRVQCLICTVNGMVQEMGGLECKHLFHPECLKSYLKSKIQANQLEMECPMDQCNYRLNNQEIYTYIDSELKRKFQTYSFNKFIEKNTASISWCPTAGCTVVFEFDRNISQYSCTVCKKEYCLRCRCEYHNGMTCDQYKRQKSSKQFDDAFLVFAQGAKFKQCPNCKFWVERITGCNSMNCKCGQNFCYNCGGTGCEHFKCKRA